jgi:hypothetical protein
MPIGQIQKNYIQQNSVGVGFYGYSGFSGWSSWSGQSGTSGQSGASGWSGWSGPAGIGTLPTGSVLWQDTRWVADDDNNSWNFGVWGDPGSTDWDYLPIASNLHPAGALYSSSDIDDITGYTTKARICAALKIAGGNSGDYFAMRLMKHTMTSGGSVYGTLVSGTECSGVRPTNTSIGGFLPVQGSLVDLPGDGYYFVEIWDYHTQASPGLPPHIIEIQFAKVKD